jgi:hypothetical protein
MIKLIKRTTDNKFLKSIDNDNWVDDSRDGFEMTYLECENIKSILLNSYSEEQIKEIVNLTKSKFTTKQERKIIKNLLK